MRTILLLAVLTLAAVAAGATGPCPPVVPPGVTVLPVNSPLPPPPGWKYVCGDVWWWFGPLSHMSQDPSWAFASGGTSLAVQTCFLPLIFCDAQGQNCHPPTGPTASTVCTDPAVTPKKFLLFVDWCSRLQLAPLPQGATAADADRVLRQVGCR